MHTETELARVISPEEEKLKSKRRELAGLLSELVERELSLVSLKADLAAFEGQYLREVGVLYAELANAPKLLLTATPLKNSLLELFGLVIRCQYRWEALEVCTDPARHHH